MAESREWAIEAYDVIRRADDIDRIVAHLEDVRRPDGSHYTRADIVSVKKHVFHEEHLLKATDGGLIRARFEAHPEIAEAWHRLEAGQHIASDLLLLEHELAEHEYLAEHPEASYVEAHRAANEIADWEHERQAQLEEHHPEAVRSEGDQSILDEYSDHRSVVPGQTGAEILPPRDDIAGPNGEPIWDIPEGHFGGIGSGKPITQSIRDKFNVGINADPNRPTPMCSYCRVNHAVEVDHVFPRVDRGDLDPTNLAPSCRPCNASKGRGSFPKNMHDDYEGIFPPPHWPETMKEVAGKPYGHHPKVEGHLRYELIRAKQELLKKSREYAERIAKKEKLDPNRRGRRRTIKEIEYGYRKSIEKDFQKLEDEACKLVRRTTFDPEVFRAWISEGEKTQINIRSGPDTEGERVVYIAGDSSRPGILVDLKTSEHFIANLVRHARTASDPRKLEQTAMADLVTGRDEIVVGSIEDALAYGRGQEVVPWVPDRGNAYAHRYPTGLVDRDRVDQRGQTDVPSSKPQRPIDRDTLSLGEREQLRDQAARDRKASKEVLDYRELQRRVRPGEHDEFERSLDARQRARDDLERRLDVREHHRDLRERGELTPEQRMNDAKENSLDAQVRANLEREYMRDLRQRERYYRALDRELPERIRDLDGREASLDARERTLDEREIERIEQARAGLAEGREIDPQLEQARQLDERERVLIERQRDQI
ncbi:HNH endonuclease, partial [Nocardia terpenica]|uniref:HNH endonuclease n=1 Tax=Nocardia terpenica TaxID=455432 RepID=UPI002FE0C5A7